jgi:hypothetical protein
MHSGKAYIAAAPVLEEVVGEGNRLLQIRRMYSNPENVGAGKLRAFGDFVREQFILVA